MNYPMYKPIYDFLLTPIWVTYKDTLKENIEFLSEEKMPESISLLFGWKSILFNMYDQPGEFDKELIKVITDTASPMNDPLLLDCQRALVFDIGLIEYFKTYNTRRIAQLQLVSNQVHSDRLRLYRELINNLYVEVIIKYIKTPLDKITMEELGPFKPLNDYDVFQTKCLLAYIRLESIESTELSDIYEYIHKNMEKDPLYKYLLLDVTKLMFRRLFPRIIITLTLGCIQSSILFIYYKLHMPCTINKCVISSDLSLFALGGMISTGMFLLGSIVPVTKDIVLPLSKDLEVIFCLYIFGMGIRTCQELGGKESHYLYVVSCIMIVFSIVLLASISGITSIL